METNIHYTIVGAFVIILISAIVLAIIWLSSGFAFKTRAIYLVYMTEPVGGLNIDSPVEFNGVGVGNVKSIEIDHNNPQRVKLLLDILSSTPISEGTVATLNSRGVTGVTYIALKDVGNDLRPLVKKAGQPYPVITPAPSLFMRLDTALSEISRTFQSVFNKENQKYIKETLANLSRITGELAANNKKLITIISNTSKASQQLTPLLNSSVITMRTLETQTLPITYRILNNLDLMTRNLAEVSGELKQNPSILIRGKTPARLGPGERK